MPIKTWDASGVNVLFDSDSVTNGVCLGAFMVPGGTSFFKEFTLLAGATVRVMSLSGDVDSTAFSITYPGSVPTISATSVAFTRYIVIWCTGTPTITSGAGMQAVGSAGTVALSPAARGCVYQGKAVYSSAVASSGSPRLGGSLGYQTLTFSSPTPPVVVLGVTNSTYSAIGLPVNTGGSSWSIAARSMATVPLNGDTSWPTLLTPDLYIFAPPLSPGSGAQAALYDTDGTLAYDLMAGRMLTTAGPLSFPAGTGLDAYAQALPAGISSSLCGVFGVPYYNEVRSLRLNPTTWVQRTMTATWNLSGGSLQRVRTIIDAVQDPDPRTVFNESSAVAEIVDLTGL